jgi:Fic family protein
MEKIIEEIDNLAGELKSLLPMNAVSQRKLDKKIRLEFNYNSNHIEGNTLTYGETELLLIFDKTTGNHELREYEEMRAHDLAFEIIKEWAKDPERPLTEAAVKNLHEKLLVRPFWKEAITPEGQQTRRLIEIGSYKKYPNSVRLQNGEIFHYTSPADTPIQMGELIEWYKAEEIKGTHPLVIAAVLHYKFVRIHPFDDGNGRISRLLMNYVLLKNNLPPVVIKASDKKGYLFALNEADTGNINRFINYIVTQLQWSLNLFLKAAKGEEVEDPEDLDKKIFLLEKDLDAVDPELEVKSYFSRELFLNLLKGWIKDLMLEAIPTIQKFNNLFTGINHHISITNSSFVQFVSENPSEIAQKVISNAEENEKNFSIHETRLRIQTFYGTLKKGGLKSFGCNYAIEIKFEQLKYEVLVDEFVEQSNSRAEKKIFEKLLHHPLTESEVIMVAKKIADTIYAHIDFNTKKIGLR